MQLVEIAKHFDLRGENALAEMAGQQEKKQYENRHQNVVSRGLFEFVEQRIPKPTSSEAVFLDICCGTGPFAIYPAYLGYKVEGVDISERSIEAARVRMSHHGFQEMAQDFVAGDALAYLDRFEEKYDVIQCMASFYYLKDTNIIEKIWRALKPGGVFLGVETNGMNPLSSALRKLKHRRLKHRDAATLNNLLRSRDFEGMEAVFTDFETVPLDFLTFAGLTGRWIPRAASLAYGIGRVADQALFRLPGFDRLAFRIGYEGKKPLQASM